MKCPLCGFTFDRNDERCHAGCPLSAHCTIICCPNCGYQTVDDSRGFVGRMGRWMGRRRRHRHAAPGAIPISHADPGEDLEVVEIRPGRARRLERLSALGIVPTAVVRLRQRHPAPVLEVGQTQVAIDADIARQIYVRPHASPTPHFRHSEGGGPRRREGARAPGRARWRGGFKAPWS